VAAQGASTAIGTNTVTDTTSTWTDNQYNGVVIGTTTYPAYFVEITGPTGGSGIGTMYDITGTNAATHTVTVTPNLAAGIAAGATYRIRPHWTISSVFGATDTAGLQGGTSPSLADKILVYNTTTAGYDSYYYKTNGTTPGWRKIGDTVTDQGAVTLYPEQGLLLNRIASSNLSITLMGAVKTGQTSVPIVTGANVMGNNYAAAMTLTDSGLYTGNSSTGLLGGTSSTTADKVYIYNTTTLGYDTYYYKTNGLTPGWRVVGDTTTDKGTTTQLGVGVAFIVQRGGAAFNWVIPQHPTSF
jgi:uncharacterized protein (TIGR02597 family)